MRKFVALLFCGLISTGLAAQESFISPDQERIISYNSDIVINTDGSIDVTETIKVFANGEDIRRGIYRAYPVDYTDNDGFATSVIFEVEEVLKDGQPEPYHIESEYNGKVVYIGDPDVYLSMGEYTYTIRYHSERQLGFFDEYDELYYNINGTGWVFPIEKVSATIHLPEGGSIVQYDGYTGYEGDDGKDFEVTEGEDEITFTTTRPFGAYENLTIAVAWPKGIVTEPPNPMKEVYLWLDEWHLPISGAFLLLLFFYWYSRWKKIGIDPPKGAIIPQFEPPAGFTPADCHFVFYEKYGNKALAADIVDMATKGVLSIKYKKGKFSLHTVDEWKAKELPAAQRKLFYDALGPGRKELELDQKNHSRIGRMVTEHQANIRKELDGVYFKMNRSSIFLALLITVVGSMFLVPWGRVEAGILILLLSIASLIAISLTSATFGTLMTYLDKRYGGGATVGLMIVTVPALLVYFYILYDFLRSWPILLLVMCFIAVNAVFFYLIKAPTVKGRKMMDHLEGLRLFLKTAEEDRFNRLQSRETALEFFEKLLPFAIALGVENEWGEHFESFFKSDTGDDYRPMWYYNSSMTHFSSSAFSNSIGSSLTSNISSSSTAPGSSSGSGGGGSSGGGGGGGGGGGW